MQAVIRVLRLRATIGTIIALLLAVAPMNARGAVVFTSLRCEDGGRPIMDFSGGTGPKLCRPSLWRVNDDGSDLRRLTTGAFPENEEDFLSGDNDPSWSPAGTHIVFSRQTREGYGRFRLVTMNADGTNPSLLTKEPLPEGAIDEQQPQWSPDGRTIVFAAFPLNPRSGQFPVHSIFRVDPDGRNIRRLTPLSEDAFSPAISPDGRRIAYFRAVTESRQGKPTILLDAGIWLMNADGSNRVRLTAGDVQIASNGFNFSPDGRYLALTIAHRLYTIELDTGGLREVKAATGVALEPAWALPGPKLIYQAQPPEDPHGRRVGLFQLDLSERAPPTQLTPPVAQDRSAAWHPLGIGLPLPPLGDAVPPVAMLLRQLERAGLSRLSGGGPAGTSPSQGRLPFLAVDRSGIRRVEAAVGRRVTRGRCRFLHGKKLGRPSSCTRPVYAKVPNMSRWRDRTQTLPDGTYEVRFRTSDVRGNVTKRPRKRVIRLR